ncbi:hypothetical protein BU24DRAFT_468295 [Aaosphaeria arxii CBS 175.79]|uniref:NlpC/P60 domain-containing protein n=1 Tax=Aaosphaeria arxii CBS 175.79 TaxID=1450172 RepID=A0A6A5X8F0_9PLEO|nr:uncharacterized protein BU24DRAFT_468295 [Aaosphaeria arxii CBS 175.79]KAF2009325.1 hypothetical protein BU24DRAFT_468295 [Aaosphaeria arxii CBS 175.79]
MLPMTIISSLIFFTAISASALEPRAKVDGPCTGKSGIGGVCISTSSCTKDGGSYISNACPGTPDDIKCCTKPNCQSGSQSGDCRFTDKCTGGKPILSNLCPGPNDFKCCITNSNGQNLGQLILAKAKTAEGTPYHWGGGNCNGPTGGGYDCSGLVSWAICQVTGRNLFSEGLRVTRSMYCASESKLKYKKLNFADRRAGDAVFFGGKCDCANDPEGIHHVGLMMNSGYDMWNALKTGTKVRKDNFQNWSEKPCPKVIRF